MNASVNVRRRQKQPSQIDCKWWKKGHCRRGDACYFRHVEELHGIDDSAVAAKDSEDNADNIANGAEKCGICLETPSQYGLLTECDHVFCLSCIRSWRSSIKHQDGVTDPYTKRQRNHTKRCPMCRIQSKFVVPSSVFPSRPSRINMIQSNAGEAHTKDDVDMQQNEGEAAKPRNSIKEVIIGNYLARLKDIPCRYFEKSIADGQKATIANEKSRPFLPVCFFTNSCHYAHKYPFTGEPFIYTESQIKEVNEIRRIRRAAREGTLRVRRIGDENYFMIRGEIYDSSDDGDFDDDIDDDYDDDYDYDFDDDEDEDGEWEDMDDSDDEDCSDICDDALIPIPFGALPGLF